MQATFYFGDEAQNMLGDRRGRGVELVALVRDDRRHAISWVERDQPPNTAHLFFAGAAPLPEMEARSLRPVLEGSAPDEAHREVAISGPQVMKGYWNRSEETERVFREIEGRRYFLSGDIGHIVTYSTPRSTR